MITFQSMSINTFSDEWTVVRNNSKHSLLQLTEIHKYAIHK